MAKAHALNLDKDIITNRQISASIGVTFFVLAMILGAYVRIPVSGSPVPITLQTFFVVLSGAVLGAKLGACSQLGYLILGASGLPVFQGYAAGIAHLAGPTGGYLIGFVFASFIVGRLSREAGITAYRLASYLVAGHLVIYSFGIIWLVLLYKVAVVKAIAMGALPFIPGDIVKTIAAVTIYFKISNRMRRIFSP